MNQWEPIMRGVFATLPPKKTPEELEVHMKKRRALLQRWEEDAENRSRTRSVASTLS